MWNSGSIDFMMEFITTCKPGGQTPAWDLNNNTNDNDVRIKRLHTSVRFLTGDSGDESQRSQDSERAECLHVKAAAFLSHLSLHSTQVIDGVHRYWEQPEERQLHYQKHYWEQPEERQLHY